MFLNQELVKVSRLCESGYNGMTSCDSACSNREEIRRSVKEILLSKYFKAKKIIYRFAVEYRTLPYRNCVRLLTLFLDRLALALNEETPLEKSRAYLSEAEKYLALSSLRVAEFVLRDKLSKVKRHIRVLRFWPFRSNPLRDANLFKRVERTEELLSKVEQWQYDRFEVDVYEAALEGWDEATALACDTHIGEDLLKVIITLPSLVALGFVLFAVVPVSLHRFKDALPYLIVLVLILLNFGGIRRWVHDRFEYFRRERGD